MLKIVRPKTLLPALLFAASSSYASGFQLNEQSAAQMGNFFAGGAASANDASTEFYNPAGMTRLKHAEISGGGVLIITDMPYNGSFGTINGSANGGVTEFVPNLHYVQPINQRLAFGFGVTVPFGLSTNYGNNSFVSAAASLSEIRTINLNPNLAYKINDHVSIGAGFSAQYLKARLNTSMLKNTVSDWGYGWNLGMLFELSTKTRIGVSYRSAVGHSSKGHSEFTTTGVTKDNTRSSNRLPATTTISVFQPLGKWDVMASAYFTQWSSIKTITLTNTASPLNSGTVSLPENFRDTWMFSVGSNYHFTQQWMLRTGLVYDQSPVNDIDRSLRLPDGNRIIAATGVHYAPIENLEIDLSYSYVFSTKPVRINQAASPGVSARNGSVNPNSNLVGLQLTWKFA